MEKKMMGPNEYGIVHSYNRAYHLTEKPTEIDFGVYVAEAIGDDGNLVEIELEGWDDGDYDFDDPYSID